MFVDTPAIARVTAAPSNVTSAQTSDPLQEPEINPLEEGTVPEPQSIAASSFVDPNEATGTTIIWSPFHSEASASGFANRLTRELAHPFRVKKQAPAQYVVSYDYSDAQHKAQLEARIKALTGAKP